MDTLTILEKLKKKRPDLKDDPLMMELEMGLSEEGGMDEVALRQAKPGAMSYLDEEAGAEGEMAAGEDMQADALMQELDAEEGMETEADALLGAEGDGEQTNSPASYLDEEEEDEEEMPVMKKKMKGSKGMSNFAR